MNSVSSATPATEQIEGGPATQGEKASSQVVHDLRNVLTGLIGTVSLLRDHPDIPPDIAAGLAAIERSALQARTLSLQIGSTKEAGHARSLAAAEATSKPPAPPQVQPGSAGRILAMDDEPGIRALLSAALTHFGYKATTVSDGADAVREYQRALDAKEPYAAVIMDLTVPGGMGGKETVQALKAIDPNVRAIVSSGYSTDPAISDFQQHGFVARVDKPYRIQELGAVLREALRN